MPRIKMIMKRNIFLVFFSFFIVNFLSTVPSVFSDVHFNIRFFDKKIYYPESDIELKITLTNQSPEVYRFRLADNRAFSLGFDVRNLSNQSLKQSRKFITDKNSNQPVFFREVRIDPSEEFSFTVNLKDFVDIEQSGVYTVQSTFFPELNNSSQPSGISSNLLSLQVRPSVGGVEAVKDKIDRDTGELLKETPLPPDQTVQFTIDARSKGQWNKFFLYIDIESLYQKSPSGARAYRNMSETARIEALKRFRDDLMASKADAEILTIPTEYEIIKTTYTAREGVVEVIQKFAQKGFKEVKQYTYYLYKKDSVWKIYNYDVRNLGTE